MITLSFSRMLKSANTDMKKPSLILLLILQLGFFGLSGAYALNTSILILPQIERCELSLKDSNCRYDILAAGGEIGIGFDDPETELGLFAQIGVSVAGRKNLVGYNDYFSSVKGRMDVYDYNAALGLKWEHPLEKIGLYADIHLSWDSVAFQKGSVQEWKRLSFHVFGMGFAAGLELPISGSVDLFMECSYDIGFISFTAERERTRWKTSGTTVERINSSSSVAKVLIGAISRF